MVPEKVSLANAWDGPINVGWKIQGAGPLCVGEWTGSGGLIVFLVTSTITLNV